MASNRSLWLALGAGLLAGASVAAYRSRQRMRRSAVGPEYLEHWNSPAASDLPGMSTADRAADLGSASTATRSPLSGNGPSAI